jgi:hypothetical protein
MDALHTYSYSSLLMITVALSCKAQSVSPIHLARTLPSSAPRNLLTISANHEGSLQRISFHIRLLVLQTAVMLLMAMLSAVMQVVVVVMVMMHVRFLAS